MDLKVATPQIVLNCAAFLQEHKYWEDSFKYARVHGCFGGGARAGVGAGGLRAPPGPPVLPGS